MRAKFIKTLLPALTVLAVLSGCGAQAGTSVTGTGAVDASCRVTPTQLGEERGTLGKVDPLVPPNTASSGYVCEYQLAEDDTWQLTHRSLTDEELQRLIRLATLSNEPAIYEWVDPYDINKHIVELHLSYGDKTVTIHHDLGSSVTISVVGGDSIMSPGGAELIRGLVGG